MISRVSIIIVNYNSKKILEECLTNLKEVCSEYEVIVVDNSSEDASPELVKQNFPLVKLFPLKENKGLSVAGNVGLDNASGEYLLYLGSDAFPQKGVIEGLINYFDQNPEVGIATCKLQLRDGSLDMDAHRGFPSPWVALCHFSGLDRVFKKSRLFGRYFMEYEDLSKPHEIDLCISHFMFIRKMVLQKIGRWDEDYFVYGEDVDICYRVKQAGYKIMYLPQFTAIHYKGVSVGIRKETKDITTATAETKRKLTQATTQAMKMFYSKHYAKVYPKFLSWFVLTAIKLISKLREQRTD